MAGLGSRSATTAPAPRSTASRQKRCPSERIPVTATNRLPGMTARESASIDETATPLRGGGPGRRVTGWGRPAASSSAESGRVEPACCTVAVYGRVAAIMPGKKQKGTPLSLADALTATRAARSRVLALAARLEATERTILAAMAAPPAPRAAPAAGTAPAKRPVGRPRTRPVTDTAPAPGAKRRATATGTTTPKRPAGRPKG